MKKLTTVERWQKSTGQQISGQMTAGNAIAILRHIGIFDIPERLLQLPEYFWITFSDNHMFYYDLDGKRVDLD